MDVIAFVVAMRNGGNEWKAIEREVETRFGDKPSIRQMRTWWNHYGTRPSISTPAIAQRVLSERRRELLAGSSEALAKLAALTGQLRELGVPPKEAFWISFLSLLEDQVGRGDLDSVYQYYQHWRDRLPEQVQPQSDDQQNPDEQT